VVSLTAAESMFTKTMNFDIGPTNSESLTINYVPPSAQSARWRVMWLTILASRYELEQLMSKKITRPPAPITSAKVKRLAGEGLRRPSQLSTKQVQDLAASVMAHIEPRKFKRLTEKK
jgi:hypothetical protein